MWTELGWAVDLQPSVGVWKQRGSSPEQLSGRCGEVVEQGRRALSALS